MGQYIAEWAWILTTLYQARLSWKWLMRSYIGTWKHIIHTTFINLSITQRWGLMSVRVNFKIQRRTNTNSCKFWRPFYWRPSIIFKYIGHCILDRRTCPVTNLQFSKFVCIVQSQTTGNRGGWSILKHNLRCTSVNPLWHHNSYSMSKEQSNILRWLQKRKPCNINYCPWNGKKRFKIIISISYCEFSVHTS